MASLFALDGDGDGNGDGNLVGHISVLMKRLQDNQKRMNRVLRNLNSHTDATEIPRGIPNGAAYPSAESLTNLGILHDLNNHEASTPCNSSSTRAGDSIGTIRSLKTAATSDSIHELEKSPLYNTRKIDVENQYNEEVCGYPSYQRSIENLVELEELDDLENRLATSCIDDASDKHEALKQGNTCTPFSVRVKREFIERHTSGIDSNLENLRRSIMKENFEREMCSRYFDELKVRAAPSLVSLRSGARNDADLHNIVSRTLKDTANLTSSMYLSGSTDPITAFRKGFNTNDGLKSTAATKKSVYAADSAKLECANAAASALNGKMDPKKSASIPLAGGRESRVRFSTRDGDTERVSEVDRDRERVSRNPEPDSINSEDEGGDEDDLDELLDRSPTYFRELSNFRYTNRHDCFSNQSTIGSFSVLSLNPLSPISERLKERLMTNSGSQLPMQEQPIYSYRLNDRLFPRPINIFTEHRSKHGGKSPKNGDRSQQHLVKVCIPENLLVKPNYSVFPTESALNKVGTTKSASNGVCSSISGTRDVGMRSPHSVASSFNGGQSSYCGSKKSRSLSQSVASSKRPRSNTNGSRNDLALRSHVDTRKVVVPMKPRTENLLHHYRQQTKSTLLGRSGTNANVRSSSDRGFSAFDGFNMLRNSTSSADFSRYAREQDEMDIAGSTSSISGQFNLPNSTSVLDLRSALGRNAT